MELSSEFATRRIPVGASPVLLGRFRAQGADVLSLSITNLGPGAFTAFELRAKVTGMPDEAAVPIKTAGFTTPDAWVPQASADPVTLAAGASALLKVELYAVAEIEVWASAAAAGAAVIAAGTFKG